MPHRSRKDHGRTAEQSILFQTVEDNPTLLDLLETATSPTRQTIFIKSLMKTRPPALTVYENTKTSVELFLLFTAWFGSYSASGSATQFQRIDAAVKHRKKYFIERRFQKQEFMSVIGLDWSPDYRDQKISEVIPIFYLEMKTSFPL